MIVCITQRQGIRYFTRFGEIGERDRLEVELRLEDSNGQTVRIDLTPALLAEYAKHPEIGKVSPAAASDIAARSTTPVSIKESRTVRPAYLSESRKEKDELIARVRKAQLEAAEESRRKQAEINAARSERLAAARHAKGAKKNTAAADSKPEIEKTPVARRAKDTAGKASKAPAGREQAVSGTGGATRTKAASRERPPRSLEPEPAKHAAKTPSAGRASRRSADE